MIQQINLYRDDVVLRASRLDADTLLRGLAALGGVLALLSLGLGVRDRLQARWIASLRASAAQAEQELAGLERRHAAHVDTRDLDARIERVQSDLRARQQLIEYIRASSPNRSGFSPRLEGLARGRVPGLWLESFELSHGGRALALHGRALRAEQLPVFMLELGTQGPFAGTEFDELRLERPAEAGAALRFELRTAEPESAPAAPEGRG